ncbi:MAG: rhomboid family intramembrane serine protease [Bacteroidetes bacterium]|nr:rhomboid family intramembrane serine protease [Bacteroidota bacterium]
MTIILVIITVGISLLAFRKEGIFERFDLRPPKVVHGREYHRIFTHAFLHADYVHLAINMLVLYSFGTGVEEVFQGLEQQGVIFSGTFFYLLLYVSAIALSSLTTISRYRNDSAYSAVGASGAVSAVVFTFIFFAPLQKIYFYMVLPIPGIVFGVLYLVYSSYMNRRDRDHINHAAHFWGAVVGFLYPIILEPRLFGVFIENLIPR